MDNEEIEAGFAHRCPVFNHTGRIAAAISVAGQRSFE